MAQEYRVVMYQPCEVRRSITITAESADQARQIAHTGGLDMPEYATILRVLGPVGWESVRAVDDLTDEEELT